MFEYNYINPLVSVLLGIIVLKEKLSFWQIIAIILASIGVLNMVYHFRAVPWVALVLALSFSLYGLAKKKVSVGAITGITLETLIISPFALLFLLHIHIITAAELSGCSLRRSRGLWLVPAWSRPYPLFCSPAAPSACRSTWSGFCSTWP